MSVDDSGCDLSHLKKIAHMGWLLDGLHNSAHLGDSTDLADGDRADMAADDLGEMAADLGEMAADDLGEMADDLGEMAADELALSSAAKSRRGTGGSLAPLVKADRSFAAAASRSTFSCLALSALASNAGCTRVKTGLTFFGATRRSGVTALQHTAGNAIITNML